MKVLITGGAGFIGSALAKRLAAADHEIVILDSLSQQVHAEPTFSPELASVATCRRGDVRDTELVGGLLRDVEVIYHLAAETGTGQSMYEIVRYESVNLGGTASLLEAITIERPNRLRRIVLASSRAVYGEGQYRCAVDGRVFPTARGVEAMMQGLFEPLCPVCQHPVTAEPTAEDAPLAPSSYYGLTKQVQEQILQLGSRTLDISLAILRYQNVFGPGQSLSNPYTGILGLFSSLARGRGAINVFEDGLESRDFVYIDDVVDVSVACLQQDLEWPAILNVGSGVSTTVLAAAKAVVDYYRSSSEIKVTGDFRVGDIRHGIADVSQLSKLGLVPKTEFATGLARFLDWAERGDPLSQRYVASLAEMTSVGMMKTVRRGDG